MPLLTETTLLIFLASPLHRLHAGLDLAGTPREPLRGGARESAGTQGRRGRGAGQRLARPRCSPAGPHAPRRGPFVVKAPPQRRGPAGLASVELRPVAPELVPSRGAARAPHARLNVGGP